jgi:hypothetical protein
MLTDSNPIKTVVYVKTSKGTFGPYPSRMFAEQMMVSGQIPKDSSEFPQIIERLEDGREILMG